MLLLLLLLLLLSSFVWFCFVYRFGFVVDYWNEKKMPLRDVLNHFDCGYYCCCRCCSVFTCILYDCIYWRFNKHTLSIEILCRCYRCCRCRCCCCCCFLFSLVWLYFIFVFILCVRCCFVYDGALCLACSICFEQFVWANEFRMEFTPLQREYMPPLLVIASLCWFCCMYKFCAIYLTSNDGFIIGFYIAFILYLYIENRSSFSSSSSSPSLLLLRCRCRRCRRYY